MECAERLEEARPDNMGLLADALTFFQPYGFQCYVLWRSHEINYLHANLRKLVNASEKCAELCHISG